MTKPFSTPYKQKIINRLTGADAESARKVARELGLKQHTLSTWLRDARTLPDVAAKKQGLSKTWSLDEKVRILGEASKLTGTQLTALLQKEGLLLGEFEQWRRALGTDTTTPTVAARRIRGLERELARKDKALAEAAALLLLQKKVEHLWEDADDDTDAPKEK